MARRLVGPVGALVAVLIIDGLHYFTFTAPKFNHDVIQLPFWALAGYAYWAALRHGRTGALDPARVRHRHGAVGEVFRRRAGRAARAVRAVRPRCAQGAGHAGALDRGRPSRCVVMAPHLVWLVQNDFLPFAYADARAVQFKRAARLPDQAAEVPAVATGLPAAVAADRGALSAARRARAGTAVRRSRPTRSTAASSRCWRSGRSRRSCCCRS